MCLAIPMRIARFSADDHAIVECEGIEMEIGTALTKEVKPGDYVLVHAGFALEIMEKTSALDILDNLTELFTG